MRIAEVIEHQQWIVFLPDCAEIVEPALYFTCKLVTMSPYLSTIIIVRIFHEPLEGRSMRRTIDGERVALPRREA
ncbi:MAG: hypothetical protein D6690_15640 [Nitrospirae bacterium]|nr:MAG: hypothetical protein D6690_15640 [Nitrospirota bacterium]